ncbi:tRNA (N6-isopentenyl adenosine(37)-C2)-methylthiotransferase MiaB [Saprospiraceae bacterium]|nr:tRNA (N6-isopentenyl adenosine(37)-C2)-methylthiotransferase MiaB [Saprospiraceae bacterium]
MGLYNDNPTLEGLVKTIDETKQGAVLEMSDFDDDSSGKKFYIESYGCSMNFSDSEIVASILAKAGFAPTRNMDIADLILINTCSIRDKAEQTVRKRLRIFEKVKKKRKSTLIGILGCMAERLKKKLLEEEKIVDIVVGPDAYRDLPNLISSAEDGDKGVNVLLSREETYADISPLRLNSNGIVGFISIMRGCDNMCSFCVVPFTRGRERSRNAFTIVAEATDLYNKGYRDVTLLGQNVDSFKWENPETKETVSFAELLIMVAKVHPDLRVRFSTSHPKDITKDVMYAIRDYDNICKYIHLPVQSGNSRVLKLMNRTYDQEWYLNKVDEIYEIVPDCAISSDMISGFCTETEEEHKDTLKVMRHAKYSMSYMFFYSEREGTLAHRKYEDDIPLEVKKARLSEIIELQGQISAESNAADVGKTFKVLIEGDSKKSDQDFKGRNSQNKMCIFPKKEGLKTGDYVQVKIHETNSATLKGEIVG